MKTLEHESDKGVVKEIRSATDEKPLEKESVKIKRQRMRNATDEKALRKEWAEFKTHGIRNAPHKKTLRKELAEVKRQGISNTADYQALGKRTKVDSKSRPRYDTTQENNPHKRRYMGKENHKLRKQQRRDSKKKLPTEKQKNRVKDCKPCDQSL